MGDLKVGEYVRTNEGYIARFNGCNEQGNRKLYKFDGPIRDITYLVYDENHFLWASEIEEYIVDHDHYLINLIKAGDVIEYESMTDGVRVKREVIDICKVEDDYKWGEGYVTTHQDEYIKIDEIYRILGSELFEYSAYELDGCTATMSEARVIADQINSGEIGIVWDPVTMEHVLVNKEGKKLDYLKPEVRENILKWLR